MNHQAPHPDIQLLFNKQKHNQWLLRKASAEDRIAKLKALRTAIVKHIPKLYAAMAADFGKPEAEIDLTEIHPTLLELDYTIEGLPDWMHPKPVSAPFTLFGSTSNLQLEPKGVVLILGPWNFPFFLMVTPLISAVAAGNCVIMRPSEKVPKTAEAIAAIVAEVFKEEEVACVLGDVDVAEALLDCPFDHFFFTGSTRVGKHVMQKAAAHLASVTLELGGKSPTIVDESAHIDRAAKRIVWGKFLNAGQTCVAPDHVWVHASVREKFIAALKNAIADFYGADESARLHNPDLAQLIDVSAFERIRKLVESALEQGAKVEAGGSFDASTRKITPTVLSLVKKDMSVMNEEIFGPVLPILTYSSLDEVLETVRQQSKPLAFYIFTENDNNIERCKTETSVGGMVINHVVIHLGNPELPFGGIGPSGIGNYHGYHGFQTFSHARAIIQYGPLSLGPFAYPPFGRTLQAMGSRFMRWLSR